MPTLLLFGANPLSLQMAAFATAQGFTTALFSDAAQAEKIAAQAAAASLDIIQAKSYRDLPVQQWLQHPAETLAISIGAPWFFDADFLKNTLQNRMLNLHGTHLPRNRGGNLFSWQIMSGQRSGICLLHQMTEALDAGHVLDYSEFIYPASCRKPVDYLQYYEAKNLEFLQKFILNWVKNKQLTPIAAQPEYLSTYWPRLRAELHGWLDWHWGATELERFVCAFDTPYPGARCRWRGQEIILRDAWSQAIEGHTHPFQWGIVIRNNGQWLTVAANGGELLVESIEDVAGNNLIPKILPGDRLYSDPTDLDRAKQRVLKSDSGMKIQKNKPEI